MGNGMTITGFSPSALAAAAFADEALEASKFDGDAAAKLGLGVVVQRATAALPQTTAHALFTVTGGRVLVTQIVGEVTTVIQTQANNAKLVANPTATGSSVDMCAVLDITAKAVATLFGITGTASDAMVSGLAIKAQVAPIIVQAGTIDLDCAASNTGSVRWTLRFFPLDDGASVSAA